MCSIIMFWMLILNLVQEGTIDRPFKTSKSKGDFLIYDDGIAVIDPNDRSVLRVIDVRKDQEYNVELNKSGSHYIKAIRTLSNGEIVVGGYLTEDEEGNDISEFFRASLDANGKETKDYNTIKYDEPEKTKGKANIDAFAVTEEGNIFFQTYGLYESDGTYNANKYQVYYFGF